MKDEPRSPRFLTLEQVGEELNVRPSVIRALIKAGELRGIQIGGRGLWRVGRQDVEDYIADAYRLTAERVVAGDMRDDQPSGAESRMAEDSSISGSKAAKVTSEEPSLSLSCKLKDLRRCWRRSRPSKKGPPARRPNVAAGGAAERAHATVTSDSTSVVRLLARYEKAHHSNLRGVLLCR